eukprot:6927547-Prymnesium_polylepis.1
MGEDACTLQLGEAYYSKYDQSRRPFNPSTCDEVSSRPGRRCLRARHGGIVRESGPGFSTKPAK